MTASSAKLPLLLVCFLSLACRTSFRADAEALAVRGAATGERLAAYYESLARDTIDQWELTAFRRGFLRLPETAGDLRKEHEGQYAALRSRARLARRLGNVYESLGRLARYDAGGEIVAAVNDLDAQLREVAESPLQQPIEKGGAVDRAIGAIAGWKQKREFRDAVELLAQVTDAVDALFRAERELYRDIIRDRAGTYRQVATELVDAKEVVSTALVDRVLSTYGLEWPAAKAAFQDERTISGIKEMIEARSKSFEAQGQTETEGVANALSALRTANGKWRTAK